MGKHIVTSKTHGRFTVMVDRQDDWIFEEYTVGIRPRSNKHLYAGFWFESKFVYLHRFIMNFPDCMVDHKNRNTLDCRRSNLRLATNEQNHANIKLPENNTSGVKGVYIKLDGKYQARIRVNKKLITLGTFDTIEEAAAARREAAQKYFGEFANKEHP